MNGKKILIAVLAIALLVGIVSAAVLTHFGRITATVTVEQSVKLDGLSMPESWGITDEVSGVAGSQIHGDLHWLTNANPDTDAIVSLDSTIISGDSDGLTIVPKFRLDAVEGNDNDDLLVIPPTTIWNDFMSISFDCFVELGSDYEKSPHINIALRDPTTGDANCLIVSSEKDVSLGVWQTITFTKSDLEGVTPIFGAIVATDMFNSISIEVANGWDVIQSGQAQTVWVKNPTITRSSDGTTLMTWFRVPHPYTGDNIPARTVHFVMGYDFAMNAAAGERTVRTEVTYQGIYTQGFTWTP